LFAIMSAHEPTWREDRMGTTGTWRRALLRAVLGAGALLAGPAAGEAVAAEDPETRPVLLVGNNWDGTADVLDVPTFRRLARIDVVPDLAERRREILLDPVRAAFFTLIRFQIGEGHDQLVDDLFASPDGRTLYVSRPSLADVVAIDLATNRIVWRRPVDGQRADHMAISPDGRRLAVSASTANVVDVIDTATGNIVGTFPSGSSPHENNYSKDGSRIFHASIGLVYTPLDDPLLDTAKGERVFQIVDANTLEVLKRIDMGEKLAEFGRPGMSSAMRPMALSPDERFLYFQVSFFHGFVEYDLQADRVTRVKDLPLSDKAEKLRRDEYLLDSAHHGIAMDGAGTKLCVAGTMSDYAAIVHRDDFSFRIHPLGARTYWATTSADGKYCYVSVAGDDTMSILSYETEQEVARVPVGDHPQRARTANVATAIFGAPPQAGRLRPVSLSAKATRVRGGRVRVAGTLRVPEGIPAGAGCRGTVRIDLARRGRVAKRVRAPVRARGARCTYARTVRAPRGRGRLTAQARFGGNEALLPARSRRAPAR
jgi:YVTN family beta-propeller protein